MLFRSLKSTILAGFFTVDGFDRTDRVSGAKPTAPIRLSRRSGAGKNVLHPSQASWSRVGLKPDLDRPVDTPNPGRPSCPTLRSTKFLSTYIAMAPHAVSLMLIQIDDSVQQLVYYVSKSLHEAEVRYLPLKKAILAVVHATRKLPHYFQEHTVVVLTRLPLKSVLRSADYMGRIAKWSTVLRAFDIKYMPRSSVKGQVLADLIAEFAEPPMKILAEEQNMDEKSVGTISVQGPSR